MADRDFSCPTPHPTEVRSTMLSAARQWQTVALKWRSLAERRHEHFVDLYKTGRWRHYYEQPEFLLEFAKAAALAERWARIAPAPEARRLPEVNFEQLWAA